MKIRERTEVAVLKLQALNKKKWVELAGLTLILAGLLLILYPLSAISLKSLNAERNYKAYSKRQAELPAPFRDKVLQEVEVYNSRLDEPEQAVVDPFGGQDYTARYALSLDPDKAFGYVRIPAIDVSLPLYLGASEDHLDLGAAHVDGTNLPFGGRGTRSVIAAHRLHYTGLMFWNLDELVPGDDVYIDVLGMELHYKVYGQEDISPNEKEKLAPLPEKDILTLLTCTPKYGVRVKRLLVNCERVLPTFESAASTHESAASESLSSFTSVTENRPAVTAASAQIKASDLTTATGSDGRSIAATSDQARALSPANEGGALRLRKYFIYALTLLTALAALALLLLIYKRLRQK